MADSVALYPESPYLYAETARTPARFRTRVVAQFLAPQNIAYLRGALARQVPAGPLREFGLRSLFADARRFAEGESPAFDVLSSDPLARRGARRPAVGLWDEVRRLNRAFIEDRVARLVEQASYFAGGPNTPGVFASRDGVTDDDEPYHMRMFTADSLRPPGLEHFNSPGPLYALLEDQSRGVSPANYARGKENFLISERDDISFRDTEYTPGVAAEDMAWGRGNPNRSAEQAVAEYWGEGYASTDSTLGETEVSGRAYSDSESWSNNWSGTRFMRYTAVPFWQRGGREGIDDDIEETLGTQARELGAHVRGWDMDKITQPRGQTYRRYGPRNGA